MALGACRSLALYFEDMNIQGILGRESRMGSLCSHSCFQTTSASRQICIIQERAEASPKVNMQTGSQTRVQAFMLPKKCLSPDRGWHTTLGILVSTVGALCFSSICKKHSFPSQPAVSFFRARLGSKRHQNWQWHIGPCGHVPRAGPQGCMSAASAAWHPELHMSVPFMAWASIAWLRGESREDNRGAGLCMEVPGPT